MATKKQNGDNSPFGVPPSDGWVLPRVGRAVSVLHPERRSRWPKLLGWRPRWKVPLMFERDRCFSRNIEPRPNTEQAVMDRHGFLQPSSDAPIGCASVGEMEPRYPATDETGL